MVARSYERHTRILRSANSCEVIRDSPFGGFRQGFGYGFVIDLDIAPRVPIQYDLEPFTFGSAEIARDELLDVLDVLPLRPTSSAIELRLWPACSPQSAVSRR